MDRRIVTLISAFVLFAVLIGGFLILDGGDSDSGSGGGEISTDLTKKPKIAASDEAPTALETNDIVEGDGATAKSGDNLSMQYVGVVTSTGKEFDASWDRGQPFEFQLGTGSVIKGWDQGIEGMKVGGRRELIIPPDLGYGAAGSPPDIPPNATLTFVVDLTDVKPAK